MLWLSTVMLCTKAVTLLPLKIYYFFTEIQILVKCEYCPITLHMFLVFIFHFLDNTFFTKIIQVSVKIKRLCSHVRVKADVFTHVRRHGDRCSGWNSLSSHHLLHWETTTTTNKEILLVTKKITFFFYFISYSILFHIFSILFHIYSILFHIQCWWLPHFITLTSSPFRGSSFGSMSFFKNFIITLLYISPCLNSHSSL